MNASPILGELKWENGQTQIRKWVSSYAYARNGNAHNPSPRHVTWLIYHDGRIVGRAAKLSEAKTLLSDCENNGE